MKKSSILLFLGVAFVLLSGFQRQQVIVSHSPSGGTITFTLIQHPKNVACTVSPCVVTTSSTSAGNLLVLWSSLQYAGTGFASLMSLSAVTDNGTSETWVHCPNSLINDAASSDATLYGMDCWYVLSAAGGATSVSATWTLSGLTGTITKKIDAEVMEYHPSSTPIFYDTGNAFFDASSCSSCAGPAGLLSGSSDVVTQSAVYGSLYGGTVITGIGGAYSNPADFDNTNHVFGAFAGALNQSSYSVPTWTSATSILPTYFSTAAFGGNSSPTPTANMLVDFSGCTNGSALTTTCVGSSTFSGWGATQDASSMGPGVTACTSIIGSTLPFNATTINGVHKTGSSTLDFCGVTNATGTNVGAYAVDFGVGSTGETPSFAQMTVGFTFESTCPATVDCGAAGVRLTSQSDQAVSHFSALADTHFCLESTGGGGCTTAGHEGGTYVANTAYRVNILMTGLTTGNSKMIVCNDGPGGTVLVNLTATPAATQNGIVAGQIGITGEEPTTVGYHYYIRNIVFNAPFSTTSCF
jgi:hypothetical protein